MNKIYLELSCDHEVYIAEWSEIIDSINFQVLTHDFSNIHVRQVFIDAAQQGVQPTVESGGELPAEVNNSEGSAPAHSG